MLVSYYVVAFGWTWLWLLPAVLAAQTGLLADPPLLLRFVSSFGPLVAALGLTAYSSGRAGVATLLGRALRAPAGPGWYLIALFGYGAIPLGATTLHVALGSPWPEWSLATLQFLPLILPFILLEGPISEEFGWRGLLLPALQGRYGALRASFIVGVTWACWHLPLAFLPGTFLRDVPFALYLAYVVALSILFTWLYNASGGSLQLTILMHGSVNTWAMLGPVGPPASNGVHLFFLTTILVWGAAGVLVLTADSHALTRPFRRSALLVIASLHVPRLRAHSDSR